MNERRKEGGSETDEREENKEEKTARARFAPHKFSSRVQTLSLDGK